MTANGFIDLTSERFGQLIVVDRIPGGARVKWNCQCDCGNKCEVLAKDLRKGNTKSCGCLRKNGKPPHEITHGQARGGANTPEYRIWIAMKSRCSNDKLWTWPYYGGRGITVCERWEKFENFFADMGLRPSKSHSIEREKNDVGYQPDNCFWATKKQQSRNKRSNVMITHDGRTQCMTDWARELHVPKTTFRAYMNKGYSIEEYLSLSDNLNLAI